MNRLITTAGLLAAAACAQNRGEPPLDCALGVAAESSIVRLSRSDPNEFFLSLSHGQPSSESVVVRLEQRKGHDLEMQLVALHYPGKPGARAGFPGPPFDALATDLRHQISQACRVTVSQAVVNREIVDHRHGLGYIE